MRPQQGIDDSRKKRGVRGSGSDARKKERTQKRKWKGKETSRAKDRIVEIVLLRVAWSQVER